MDRLTRVFLCLATACFAACAGTGASTTPTRSSAAGALVARGKPIVQPVRQGKAKTCTYEKSTSVVSGNRSASVIAADLNRDRRLDLVIASQADGLVTVALGRNGGGFEAPATYHTSTIGPYETVAGDLNGDGYPDLVSANFGAANGAPFGLTVSVHLNKGNGTLADYVDYASTDSGRDKVRAVAVGDFNEDGRLDIAAASQFTGLQVLLGNGDGTFRPHHVYPAGGSIHGVVVADFNADGHLDTAFANNSPMGGMTVVSGNGDGTFREAVRYAAGSGTFGLDTADFNGDGYADIATANMRDANISVFLNLGKSDPGRFAPAVDYPATKSSVAITAADLDGDRRPDLLSAANAGGVTDLYLNNGDGTFKPAIPLATGPGTYDTAVADFDGDGTPDIAAALIDRTTVVFRGTCR